MPRIPAHTMQDAPEATRETLSSLERKFGKLLNTHAEMAHAPVVLAAYTGIQRAIAEHGSFDAPTREAIALAVGAVNDCGYCQSAHTVGAQKAGMSLDQTVEIRSGEITFDPKLAALVTLARQIADNRGEVDDAVWKAALQAGWSEKELAELFAHVVANVFTNYFNHYADTDLDVPPAPGIDG